MNTSKSCIVIDDEIAFLKIMSFFLRKIDGLELMGTYQEADEAVTLIEAKKPDIVFLDVNISGLEGPEFINSLTHQPTVILVSGHTEDFVNAHYNLNYLAFIQKPVDHHKLATALSKL